MEVGLRQVDWEEREEVRVRQHVATLIHIALHVQAVEALKIMTIVSLNGHSQTQLPCTLTLNVVERLATH